MASRVRAMVWRSVSESGSVPRSVAPMASIGKGAGRSISKSSGQTPASTATNRVEIGPEPSRRTKS